MQSLVDVGLKRHVRIDRCLVPGVRVTVKLDPRDDSKGEWFSRGGEIMAAMYMKGGYWGDGGG
jgi:hypothetical protein